MLKHTWMCIAALLVAAPAAAQVESGKLAPNFTATDTRGNSVSLEQYRGKTVVLEWTNPECPFVVKHYGAGNMQALQKKALADGVVWLTINSAAAGKQGFLTPEEANILLAEKQSAPSAYLLDADGSVGRLYGAKTTPHMFVINAEGLLVYQGAIDSVASFDSKDIEGAENYITTTLDAIKQGKPVANASTKPYGCSVKYAD